VLKFVDEEIEKLMKHWSLAVSLVLRIGPDLSKFTLLEAT